MRFICEGFLSTFSFSSFLLKEDERESRRKENKEERAAVGLVSLRLGHATALTPHCGVIHYRGAVSLRSRELLNKFKIPPLATDCVTTVRKSDSAGFTCLRRLFVHRKRRKIRYPRLFDKLEFVSIYYHKLISLFQYISLRTRSLRLYKLSIMLVFFP